MKTFFQWLNESTQEPISITKTTPQDADEIINNAFVKCFPEYNTPEILEFAKTATNWTLSLKAVANNEIIGFYMLGTRPLEKTLEEENAKELPGENLQRYSTMKGIEGVALGVIPEYRKKGIASLFKNQVRGMGYDFIYGMQYKSLGNLQNWTKESSINRRLAAESHTDQPVYITIEDISAKAKNSTQNLLVNNSPTRNRT